MFEHKRNRRMILASSVGAVQRAISVVCTLIVMPVVLHALGAARFGIWGAATSLAWLAGVLDIGMGYALMTLVARSMARGRSSEAGTHLAGALTIGACIGAPMLLLSAVAWATGLWHVIGAPYLIAVVGLALNLPLNSANMTSMGLQEGYYSSLWELVQTLLNAGGLIAASVLKTDLWLFVAIPYASIVLANLGSLVHLYLRHPELRPEKLPVPIAEMREIARTGVGYFLMMMTGGLNYMLDNVLALQLLGPDASARMAIAMRICITVIGLLVVVSQPLWPAFTDAEHRNDRQWILHNALRSAALLVTASAVGCGVLVLFGERLLRLWLHQNLGIGVGLLLAVAGWILSQTLVRVPFLLLNALSMLRFQVVLYAVATSIALGLKFVLARWMGVAGILWATTGVVALLVFPVSIWRIRRWAQHPEEQRQSAGPEQVHTNPA